MEKKRHDLYGALLPESAPALADGMVTLSKVSMKYF